MCIRDSLDAALVVIEHVDREAALHSHHGGDQPDRTGAGNEQRAWLPPARTGADTLGMIPGLRQDAGRLEQDAEQTQARIDLDGEFGLDAEALGAIAVSFLDTALGVAPVAAHVPLAGGAGRTRLRIGPPHDADHEVARCEPAAGGGFLDGPE